jgi:hypothetical protein
MSGILGDPFGVANVVIPKGGPKVIPLRIDFSGVTEWQVDGSQVVERGKIEYIQALWVDNYSNTNPLIIEMNLTNQRIVIPARSQGYVPVLSPNPPKFIFSTQAGPMVYLQFLNVPVQPMIWTIV